MANANVPSTMHAVLLIGHSGVYKLSEFHRAQTDFMAKAFIGKLVVVPDSKWTRRQS